MSLNDEESWEVELWQAGFQMSFDDKEGWGVRLWQAGST